MKRGVCEDERRRLAVLQFWGRAENNSHIDSGYRIALSRVLSKSLWMSVISLILLPLVTLLPTPRSPLLI